MKVFSLDELIELGFLYTLDGALDYAESYYTLLLEPEDPFWGDYLVGEKVAMGCYNVFHKLEREPLTEQEVLEIIDKYK